MRLIRAIIVAGALFAPAAMADEIKLTVADARYSAEISGDAAIFFTLDPASARRFGAFTSSRVDQQIFIYLDDRLLIAPVIKSPILSGTGMLPVGDDLAETRQMIDHLKSGAEIVVSDAAR